MSDERQHTLRGNRGFRGLAATYSAVLVLVLMPVAASAATEVNTCGQVVKGSAFLSADLDCSSAGTHAVVLDGGTLDLRGFTITGDSSVGGCGTLCTRTCKVVSSPAGGLITGGSFGICDDPFDAQLARSIRVIGVVIDANDAHGISAREAAVVVTDSTITNNTGVGAESTSLIRGRLRVLNSTITNNGEGFFATQSTLLRDSVVSGDAFFGGSTNGRLTVKNSQITNNGTVGLGGAFKARILDSTISGNAAEGISMLGFTKRLRVLRSTIDANGSDGVFTDGVRTLIRDTTITNNGGDGVCHGSKHPLRLTDSIVNGNGLHGVRAGTNLRAVGSELTANGTDPACGATQTCADVAAFSFPNLSATTCGTSYDTNSGFPGTNWGVCTLD